MNDIKEEKQTAKMDLPVFATLVHSITHSALAAMGLLPEMKDKKNRAIAEFNIELLILLREKTKGNLSKEETQLLDNCIQDLQITFAKGAEDTNNNPAEEEKAPTSQGNKT